MKTGRKIKTGALMIGLMTLSLLAWAMREKLFYRKKPVVHKVIAVRDTIDDPVAYDPVLLKKLKQVCQAFDTKNKPVTYAGIVNVSDGADTTANVKNMSFMYSRGGSDCYYRTGQAETLNADGIYLYVEHDHKRVLVSAQKEAAAAPVADMGKLADQLQTEHYKLVERTEGDVETISLLNEHHITCKEYALTFDTLSHKVQNIRMRMTCFNDPMNRKKEKVVNISISRFEERANVGAYMDKDKIVAREGNSWKLRDAYMGYELIKVP